jgi:hypothetical protein
MAQAVVASPGEILSKIFNEPFDCCVLVDKKRAWCGRNIHRYEEEISAVRERVARYFADTLGVKISDRILIETVQWGKFAKDFEEERFFLSVREKELVAPFSEFLRTRFEETFDEERQTYWRSEKPYRFAEVKPEELDKIRKKFQARFKTKELPDIRRCRLIKEAKEEKFHLVVFDQFFKLIS